MNIGGIYKRSIDTAEALDDNRDNAEVVLQNVLDILDRPLRCTSLPFEDIQTYATAALAYVAAYDRLTALLDKKAADDEKIMRDSVMEDYENTHRADGSPLE